MFRYLDLIISIVFPKGRHRKRKRELFTSLTFTRHRQTPIYLKRVKAHAIRREPSTSFLIDFKFGEFGEQESKVDASTYMSVCQYLSP